MTQTFPERSLAGVIALGVLLALHPGSARGQSKLFLGVSFPVGDFASTDSAVGGFAKSGYCLGAEITTKFWYDLEIGLSGLFSYHPVDKEAMVRSNRSIPPGSPIEAGPWLLIWPTGSVGYTLPLSQNTAVYLRGHGGFLYGVTPEITVDQGGTKFTQNIALKWTFAKGLGAGVSINNQYDIGFRILSAEPDYDINVQGGGTSTQRRTTYSTTTIQLLLGYILKPRR
jgi:hypothetical protein